MAQHNNFCPVKGIKSTAPTFTAVEDMGHPVVISQIVHDGSDWCIIYSDGWKEMGGYKTVSSISAYGTVEVEFSSTIDDVSVAFASTPVYVHCTPVHTGTTTSHFTPYGVESVSSTGFTYRKTFNNTNLSGFYWVAKGL